mmetsp:Transcript_4214/g.12103  ORF Transcript_4214/g.12103 Transcript_4214/m.12103 type:complete len:504 (-) Transcript_4214:65-1576(-)
MMKRQRVPPIDFEVNSSQNTLVNGRKGRREDARQRFTISASLSVCAVLALLVSTQVQVSHSFHSPTPRAQTNRPASHATLLHVVEPKERTEYVQHAVPELDLAVSSGSAFDSFMNASEEGEGQQFENEESGEPPEESNESESEEAKAERLERAAKAAALLSRRSGSGVSGKVNTRNTSVGARRIGSASQARSGGRSVTKLSDAVRKAAAANTAKEEKNNSRKEGPSARISKSMIQSTVENMMQHTTSSMGLFGEAEPNPIAADSMLQQQPLPGTVLVSSERSTKPWKAAERVSVRVASLADDLDIANLRLSVFSDFSPDMRRAFCTKSCQVLSTRRNRGATCIVATVPRYGSLMSPRPDIILGTAECSFHEFEGTTLGRRRPLNSILYVTEVAVNPTARRKGIGQKIMQSIDQLANIRRIETIYLHVDTTNYGAMNLYKQAGYDLVPANEPMFDEFTRSLNLHDGATKGRNHYLLKKDLQQPTWLPEVNIESHRATFGFEIPA